MKKNTLFQVLLLTLPLLSLSGLPRARGYRDLTLVEKTARSKAAGGGRWIAGGRVFKNSAGYFFHTGPFAAPTGYRGASIVLLWLSPDRRTIRRAALIASDDTPSYVRLLVRRGHLKRYWNRSVATLLSGGEDNTVDVVSGATRTCDAIHRSIVRSLKRVLPML